MVLIIPSWNKFLRQTCFSRDILIQYKIITRMASAHRWFHVGTFTSRFQLCFGWHAFFYRHNDTSYETKQPRPLFNLENWWQIWNFHQQLHKIVRQPISWITNGCQIDNQNCWRASTTYEKKMAQKIFNTNLIRKKRLACSRCWTNLYIQSL